MDQAQFTPNPRKNKHLTLSERVKIELLLQDGKTPYAIGKALQRPTSTICNEIQRGTVEQMKTGKRIRRYFADRGQAAYDRNRKECGRKYQVLECDAFIKHVEVQMLKNDWSADSAVGRTLASGTFSKTVCTKTIYNYIDLGLMKVKNIDLPLKLRRRTKGASIRSNKRVLGESITDRPAYIDEREEFGHWEIDTVIGSKSKEDEVLLTIVERKTRNTFVRKIPGKTAEAVMAEMQRIREEFGTMFCSVFRTITSDNGSEFASLAALKDLGTKVYFTHPYSAFERGTNERHNGLLRRFVHKGKKISDYCLDAILRLEEWINGLPRRILGYKTPEELFEAELDAIYAL